MPFSPHCHFERKREIFFVCGQERLRGKRGTGNMLHATWGVWCFMQTALRRKTETGNEKDPSAALGMTIREYRFPQRRCEITIISFSRSICRGGLAALIGVTGKPYPSCLSCHSHPIRPCGAPSPRGEGCDTRIPSSKKGGEAATSTLNPEP